MCSHLMEDRVEEELPGGGPQARVQLQAAEGEVPEGRGQAGGHRGGLRSTRYLGGQTRLVSITRFRYMLCKHPAHSKVALL